MLLYYITGRKQFAGTDDDQKRRLLDKVEEAAVAGIDFVQLRERDLTVRELERLAREAVGRVRQAKGNTRLLINSRTDVALAVGADGVHLRADDVRASDARAAAGSRGQFVIGVSCHTLDEVRSAWSDGADFAVFGPVFEKAGGKGKGIGALREVCAAAPHFVFALGGVTAENAGACGKAGAVGIAGIRLYQETDMPTLVESLRRTEKILPKNG